eukprot:4236898-Pleurochrysis_carterae.AAC.1
MVKALLLRVCNQLGVATGPCRAQGPFQVPTQGATPKVLAARRNENVAEFWCDTEHMAKPCCRDDVIRASPTGLQVVNVFL